MQSFTSLNPDSTEMKFIENFSKSKTANEFEVRFGTYTDEDEAFHARVTLSTFKTILARLLADVSEYENQGDIELLKIDTESGPTLIVKGREDISRYIKDSISSSINWESYKKTKTKPFDNKDYGYRLSSATESPIDDPFAVAQKYKLALKTFRYMKRYSFTTGSVRYDLSIVKAKYAPAANIAASNVFSASPTYEVEIEYIGTSRHTDDIAKALHREIYVVLGLTQNAQFPMSRSQVKMVIADYMTHLWRGRPTKLDEVMLRPFRYFLGAMPVSLTLENVVPLDIAGDAPNLRRPFPNEYTVTEKADGERRLLFVASSGYVFFITRNFEISFTGLTSVHVNTLIDGEWLPHMHRYLAFDMLFFSGKDLRHSPLLKAGKEKTSPPGRMNRLESLLSSKTPFTAIADAVTHITLKRHLRDPDILSRAAKLWNNRKEDFKYDIDGVFFTPRAGRYPAVERGQSTWYDCLKWKPRSLLSIDFKIFIKGDIRFRLEKSSSGEDIMRPYRVVHLYVQKPERRQDNTPPAVIPFEPTMQVSRIIEPHVARMFIDEENHLFAKDPLDGKKTVFRNGDIVELVYDTSAPGGYEWTAIRVRTDKTVPNSFKTADQVWSGIHEAKGLLSDDRFFDLVGDKINDKLLRDEYQSKSQSYYASRDTLAERRASDIYGLRGYHNHVKRQLYMAASKALTIERDDKEITALLDLGCGRGGDYAKYREAGIQRVYGVDTDKAGLVRLVQDFHEKQRRAGKNPRVVVTFQADMKRLLSDGSAALTQQDKKGLEDFYHRFGTMFFPLVSCQFAMHYSFEDEISMRGFMMNIYQNLKIGGYFIATTFDGQAVFDLLKKQNEVSFSTNDTVFATIAKRYSSTSLSAYGQKIDIRFKTISSEAREEYLVDFEAFKETMHNDYDIDVVSAAEAQAIGLPEGTGTFDMLYDKTLDQYKLSADEMRWSFMCRFMVMKKTGNGNAVVLQRWLKKLQGHAPSIFG